MLEIDRLLDIILRTSININIPYYIDQYFFIHFESQPIHYTPVIIIIIFVFLLLVSKPSESFTQFREQKLIFCLALVPSAEKSFCVFLLVPSSYRKKFGRKNILSSSRSKSEENHKTGKAEVKSHDSDS